MDPNELVNYSLQVMKYGAIGIVGTYVAYNAMLAGLKSLNALFYHKINTQEELDRIVDEEAKKLEMVQVKAVLHAQFEGLARKNNVDGSLEIHVGGFGARKSVVRHELYHLYKHSGRKRPKNPVLRELESMFREEPQAMLYEIFGIKL